MTVVSWYRHPPDDRYVEGAQTLEAAVPRWALEPLAQILRDPSPKASSQPRIFAYTSDDVLIAAGWPCLALRCQATPMMTDDWAAWPGWCAWPGPGVKRVVKDGLSVPRGKRSLDDGYAVIQPPNLRVPLPVRPIWSGMIVNVTIYGVIWAALLLVPRAAQLRLRVRRGHCPACNYDLRATPPGHPCPECGRSNAAVPTTAR